MNLLCPNCQKLLTVPDQNAGQTIPCPLCNKPFLVPALAPASPAFANVAAPPSPAAPFAAGSPYRADTFVPAAESPPASSRRTEETSRAPAAPEPPHPQPAEPMPSTSPPIGYEHTRTLWLSPRVVPWIAPVCLFLLFILLFFPWLGMYPGGVPVYTQSGWGTAFGSYWSNPVWEKVSKFESEKHAPGVSVPMIFYVLVLLLLGLPAAVISVLMSVAPQTLSPKVQQFKPWRLTILGGIVLLTTVLLVLQLGVVGFSLQNALQELAAKQVESEEKQAKTPEEKETVDLKRAQFLSQYNLHPTPWVRLAVFGHLIALAGVGLDWWLQRRGARPLPRLDVSW